MGSMDQPEVDAPWPPFCDRCSRKLTPGEGSFYVVRIEAFADPTPPSFSAEDLRRDAKAEIERLVSEMEELSGQEAMDQVYRRLTLYLCGPCYRQWIEKPTG
jgi:hypothetical protein